MTGKYILEIIGLVAGTGILTYIYQGLIKINALENKARDTLQKVDEIDDVLRSLQKLKIEGAICKHKIKDVEKYLQKGGYHPRDIDENSFF
jgi:hypothetical protein